MKVNAKMVNGMAKAQYVLLGKRPSPQNNFQNIVAPSKTQFTNLALYKPDNRSIIHKLSTQKEKHWLCFLNLLSRNDFNQ